VFSEGCSEGLEPGTDTRTSNPLIPLSFAVALNYGASAFEGLKAFRAPDGQVRIFRPKDNAARISVRSSLTHAPRRAAQLLDGCPKC
jgi:branched-subunit amino acid aminotransferase/4-amino-4-deoxychorismate lyase